jgi:hypothetical protein
MRTIADYRQLNDALFHAGLRSGTDFEWRDEPNRLHFYVVDVHRDARGILSYTLGVRSLDGAGTQTRGVSATAPETLTVTAGGARLDVRVTNSGTPAAPPATAHPGAPAAAFDRDLYRVSVAVEGDGWTAQLQNALVAIRAGASATVPVFLDRRAGSAASGRVTVAVVSESDPTRRATAVTSVK